MKNVAKILLCSLIVPVNMALGFDLYYDVNGVCNASLLWCRNKPSADACCSGDDVVNDLASVLSSHETKDGYIFRGWTSNNGVSPVNDNVSGGLTGLVIDKNSVLRGNINASMTLRPAWAASCNNSDYCGVNVDEDGSVSYSSKCPVGWASSGSGASISCSEPELGDTIITIQYDGGEHGTITGNTSQTCVEGTVTTLQHGTIVTAETGWKFAGWNVGGETKTAGASITCSAAVQNITAVYDSQSEPELPTVRQVVINAGEGADSVNNDALEPECTDGGTYTLPNSDILRLKEGYTFQGWKVGSDEELRNPGYSVPCDDNVYDIVAIYTRASSQRTVVYNAGDHGTLRSGWETDTCTDGGDYILRGAGIIIPYSGYIFYRWKVGGAEYAPGASVPCDENVSNIVAVYKSQHQWVKVTLDDGQNVLNNNTSSPSYFWCQKNPDISGCYGCYKNNSCDSNVFASLTMIPTLANNEYQGHYLNNMQIIDSSGNLTDEWKRVSVPQNYTEITIAARWAQQTYNVTYDYSGCWSDGNVPSTCSHTAVCNAGENYTPGEPRSECVNTAGNYNFTGWNTTRTQLPCTSDLVISANCDYTPGTANSGTNSNVILRGFFKR